MAAQLVSAFVISLLNYGNATLSGLPQFTLAAPQRVLNAAACLVSDLHTREHVTSALIDLHWLAVAARIEFKICMLAYQSLNSTAPACISDMLQPVSSLQRQTNLHSATNSELFVLHICLSELVNELSVQQPLAYGMLYLQTSSELPLSYHLTRSSAVAERLRDASCH